MMFADNIVLGGENVKSIEFRLEQSRRSMKYYGMKISKTKTGYMSIGALNDRVKLVGVETEKVMAFQQNMRRINIIM